MKGIKKTSLIQVITDTYALEALDGLCISKNGLITHPLDERLGVDEVSDGLTLRKAIAVGLGIDLCVEDEEQRQINNQTVQEWYDARLEVMAGI